MIGECFHRGGSERCVVTYRGMSSCCVFVCRRTESVSIEEGVRDVYTEACHRVACSCVGAGDAELEPDKG